MIDEVFDAGYGSAAELNNLIRYSKEEMHARCNDLDLLSLFERYVTWKDHNAKLEFEEEVKTQIVIHDLLA